MEVKKERYVLFDDAVSLIAPEPERSCPMFLEREGAPNTICVIDGRTDEVARTMQAGCYQQAIYMLLRALRRNLIRAYGKNRKEVNREAIVLDNVGHHRLISQEFWAEAEYEYEDGGIFFYDGNNEYLEVYLNGEDLYKLLGWWIIDDELPSVEPNGISSAGQQVVSSALSEKRCKEWIAELALSAPVQKKRELWMEASKKFGQSLSLRGFGRAWSAAAPAKWKAPGKRNGET